MDLTTQRFGNDLLLHKGLEIDKAFALPTGSIDLAIGDGESGKQMSSSATMIARFVQHWLVWTSRTSRLLALAGLNGGFLIQADKPDTLTQEGLGLTVGMQDRTGPLQKGDGIMNVLPGVIAPGTKPFGFEPAAHRTRRDGRKRGILGDASGQFGPTPARERHLLLLGQATGDGGDVHADLRGKNASVLHCGARRQVDGSGPNDRAICVRSGPSCQRLRPVVDYFVQDGYVPEE